MPSLPSIFSKNKKDKPESQSQPKRSTDTTYPEDNKEDSASFTEDEHRELLANLESNPADPQYNWFRQILDEHHQHLKLSKTSEVLVDKVFIADTLAQWCTDSKNEMPARIAIKSVNVPGNSNSSPEIATLSIQDEIQPASQSHTISGIRASWSLQEAAKHIRDIYQVLGPGGTALMTVGSKSGDAISTITNEVLRLGYGKQQTVREKGFNRYEILGMLAEAGFCIPGILAEPKKMYVTGDMLAKLRREWRDNLSLGSVRIRPFGPKLADLLDKAFDNVVGEQDGLPNSFELVIATKPS